MPALRTRVSVGLLGLLAWLAGAGAVGCRAARSQSGSAAIGGADQGTKKKACVAVTAEPFALRVLPIAEAQRIDQLRFLDSEDAGAPPLLLVSMQEMLTPPVAGNRYALSVSALAPGNMGRLIPVAKVPRFLPPVPDWDARRSDAGGKPELVYEQPQGALYRLFVREGSGATSSADAAQPLRSFQSPRFVRGAPGSSPADVAAVLDKKELVVFTPPFREGAPPPPVLAPAYDAVVGIGPSGPWAVTRTTVHIPGDFGGLPGRLALLRFKSLAAAAVTSTTPFAGFIAVEMDAVGLAGDVVVFATGKPSALLLASRPSQRIELAADDRAWLSALSRPAISFDGQTLRMAAIVHAGTSDAKILYGEVPASALLRP